ncbi:uncharacterized protein LOC117334686 [Pecten maximus]|uniref:uncharacterized protein LOC117334686 n=1 Tax=Pecten maximus TaxID=6579 RepID=UPI0014580730|nr:uncharacterized protein LOC117334686 [Pecten maximus]
MMYQGEAIRGTQDHVYYHMQNQVGPHQGTQGHGYYQSFGAPAPPQPGQNTVSLRDSALEQNSNNNANRIPGQPTSLSTSNSLALQPSTSQPSNSSQRRNMQQGYNNIQSASSLVAATNKSTRTKRHQSNAGPSKQKGKEIEVADGNLTLELPAAGSTEEQPPDGGAVAWGIVLACTILNACSTTCLMILSFSAESMKDDIGEDETESITTACNEIRLLAGLGLACWYLCAIIPILEYFQRRRLFALVLSNLGSIVSLIIVLVVYVEMTKVGNQMNRTNTLQYLAIPGAVGLAASFFLRPLQLRMNDKTGQSFVEATLGVLNLKLFKDLTLYLVMLVYFFDQFGRGIPNSYITVMMTDKEFSIWEIIIQLFMVPAGNLIGLGFLIFWKHKDLLVVLSLWGPMDLFLGFMSLQLPAFDKFGWVAIYSVLFGITQAIATSLLNNTVPDAFGVINIRLVTALLGFTAGVGQIVASPAAEDAKHEDDDYARPFYVAASMLIIAGVCALLSRYILIRKKSKESASKVNDQVDNEAGGDDDEPGENDESSEPQDDNSDIAEILNSANEIIEEVDITDME